MAEHGLADADVPAWWADLGIPGLYDVHVHFLPPPVMRKVRHQFDTAGPLIGRPWPLVYRGDDDERVAQLRALGVRRFTALVHGDAEAGRDESLGELRALQGVARFPARIRCATLAWSALDEALKAG